MQMQEFFNYLCVERVKKPVMIFFSWWGEFFSACCWKWHKPQQDEWRGLCACSTENWTDFPLPFSQNHSCQLTTKLKSVFTWKSRLSWKVLTRWKKKSEIEILLNPEVCCLTSGGLCNFYPVDPTAPVLFTFTSLTYFAKPTNFPSSCWKGKKKKKDKHNNF